MENNVGIKTDAFCTSGLLHSQLVTDLLLIGGQMLQGLLVEACFPQHLVLVEQQLAVLVVHFVWRRLAKQRGLRETNTLYDD